MSATSRPAVAMSYSGRSTMVTAATVLMAIACIISITETGSSRSTNDQPACWCGGLKARIDETETRLLSFYKHRSHLDSTPTFSSSGSDNALERRFIDVLNGGRPFYTGVLGGSYAVPMHDSVTAWTFNVTRWLNFILSAEADCSHPGSQQVDVEQWFINNTCAGHVETVFIDKACPPTRLVSSSAVLCARTQSTAVEAAYHGDSRRDLHHICDNTIRPHRPCRVFGGSGPYARSLLGSKGGSTSSYGKWTVQNLDAPDGGGMDMLIWDFSINERLGSSDLHAHHNSLYDGFFEQTVLHHPNISAFYMVYWNDITRCSRLPNYANPDALSVSNGTTSWGNGLAAVDYPILKSVFDPKQNGKLKRKTLLTMALPSFGNNTGASLNDFQSIFTRHPTSIAFSTFADLAIWNLLKLFKNIYSSQCQPRSPSLSATSGSLTPWTIDMRTNETFFSDIISTTIYEKYYHSHIKSTIRKNQRVLPAWKIVASLTTFSPVIKAPLPVEQFAYLCVPSDEGARDKYAPHEIVNAFNVGMALPDGKSTPLPWVPVNAVEFVSQSCAGWLHSGVRAPGRLDDEHMYSPTATPECILSVAKSDPSKSCLSSSSSSSTSDQSEKAGQSHEALLYPHSLWPSLPGVKAVDFVFNVSRKLEWTRVCFFKCAPTFLWQSGDNQWCQRNMSSPVRDSDLEYRFCYRLDSDLTQALDADNVAWYLLWWSADRCFPLTSVGQQFGIAQDLLLVREEVPLL